jgi:DNA ligase-1
MNFMALYRSLDSTNSTLDKVEALRSFFASAPPEESALAIRLILGDLPPKKLKTAEIRALAFARTKIPLWLFEEAYSATGDLAETIALIAEGENPNPFEGSVATWIEENLRTRETALAALDQAFGTLDSFSLFVLMKLMTGGLRVGVARGILIQALAKTYEIPDAQIAHSLTGKTKVDAEFLERLRAKDWEGTLHLASAFPFALASPIESAAVRDLGSVEDWLFEWKWDGIRGQWIDRGGEVSVWSRGEELVTDRFPELALKPEMRASLPFHSLALDGEILAWKGGEDSPLPFQFLQTRISRKKLTASVLKTAPVRFVAYDCLEKDGVDLRERPLEERRTILEEAIAALTRINPAFSVSGSVAPDSWEEAARLRESSRERGVEGFILKRRGSRYFHGRKRGDWWKWKTDPMTLDAVLIYAQSGHGKRSNLFTDYTFALQGEGGELVPVAKAYSGLDHEEIMELDRWIRKNTRERFGPVRSVEPLQVFELAFEGIGESPRHKSGIALRFPRILRWRRDKPVTEIDRVEDVRARYLVPNVTAASREREQEEHPSLFGEGARP